MLPARLHRQRGERKALWGSAPMCLERWFDKLTNRLLLQIPDDLMTIGSSVASARDVNPEVLTVGGLHEQLIKIAVVLNPVEPAIMVHD